MNNMMGGAGAAPDAGVAQEDLVVIQIPKSQLDMVAQGISMLNDLIMGARQKAEGDIAQQTQGAAPQKGGANPQDAEMIAQLEAMDRGGQ